MTALAWGLLAAIVMLGVCWPRYGVASRIRNRRVQTTRERADNALKHLLLEQQAARTASFTSLKGTLRLRDGAVLRVLEGLRAASLAVSEGGQYRLTPAGEHRARHLVRAHRLLERYLADEARLPLTAVHGVAERLEHRLTEAEADRLSASLGHPERDPHGDPIPSAGEAIEDLGAPITTRATGTEGRIVHLEDEPTMTFRALVQLGLRPDQVFRVLDTSADALRLRVEGRDLALPMRHAGNVFVESLDGDAIDDAGLVALADLPAHDAAEIVSLAPACQGYTRRRLLDLGFTPGTRLQPVLETFVGDPRAYRLRGTTIALRRDQASAVIVRPCRDAEMAGSESRPYQP